MRQNVNDYHKLNDEERQRRWRQEAEYFDREAEGLISNIGITNPGIVRRYQDPEGKTPLEFCHKVAGKLTGKHILDVGCGNGSTSVLLAQLGGTVTGIDISSRSIDAARIRAQINNVEQNTTFICSPLETVDLKEGSFDVVWCEAILHHLLKDIEPIMDHLRRWAKTDGVIIVSEPINHAQWLRKFRMTIPVEVNGTPDERPLLRSETKSIQKYLSQGHVRYFRLLLRLERVLFRDSVYEQSPKWRQVAFDFAAWLDSILTRLPGVKHLSSMAVIYGKPRKST